MACVRGGSGGACFLFGLGAIVLVIALVFQFYAYEKLNREHQQKYYSLEDPDIYEKWAKGIEATISVYFFNITNPDEVLAGQDPILEEIGPFVYDHFSNKTNIIQPVNDSGIISYQYNNTCVFNATLSGNRTEKDVITMLDFAYMSLVLVATGADPMIASRLTRVLPVMYPNRNTPFVTASVRDLLIDGISLNCTNPDLLVNILCRTLANQVPEFFWKNEYRDYRFAFLREKTSLSPIIYTAYTGSHDITMRAQLYSVNGKRNLSAWNDEYCDMINGSTDGTLGSFKDQQHPIYLYEGMLHRSLPSKYDKTLSVDGIPVWRFVAPKETFDTDVKIVENNCYCPADPPDVENAPDILKCPKEGFFSLAKAAQAPVLVSFPWMIFNEPNSALEIMQKPLTHDKGELMTFIEFEPRTSIVLTAHKTIQLNIELRQTNEFSFLKLVKTTIIPGMWSKLHFQIKEEDWQRVKDSISTFYLIEAAIYCSISLGVALIVAGFILHLLVRENTPKGKIEAYTGPEKVIHVNMTPVKDSASTTAYQQHFM